MIFYESFPKISRQLNNFQKKKSVMFLKIFEYNKIACLGKLVYKSLKDWIGFKK